MGFKRRIYLNSLQKLFFMIASYKKSKERLLILPLKCGTWKGVRTHESVTGKLCIDRDRSDTWG